MRETAKRLAGGAGVALATAGLTGCGTGAVAVDPPPPPFECTPQVGAGETLRAQATRSGTELTFTISEGSSGWTSAAVTAVVGGTARPVALGPPLRVVIDLADASVAAGSFTLSGTLEGTYAGARTRCPVTRTFSFRIEGGSVVVALAEELPLSSREPARIAVVGREDGELVLEARSAVEGSRFVWTVTAGEIVERDAQRMRWRLPSTPGLHQVQLVADYGARGLAFDSLAFETA